MELYFGLPSLFFRNEIDFNLIVAHVETGFAYGKIYIDVVVLRTHAPP